MRLAKDRIRQNTDRGYQERDFPIPPTFRCLVSAALIGALVGAARPGSAENFLPNLVANRHEANGRSKVYLFGIVHKANWKKSLSTSYAGAHCANETTNPYGTGMQVMGEKGW